MNAGTFVLNPVSVITGDIVNSTSLGRSQLQELLQSLQGIITGNALLAEGAPVIGLIPNQSPVFQGDAFQFTCHKSYALLLAVLFRLYVKSFFVNGDPEVKAVEVRLSIGIGRLEAEEAPYEAPFVLSGRGLDKRRRSYLSILAEGSGAEEVAVMAVLVDAILKPLTPKQSRSLLYTLTLHGVSYAAKKLGVEPSTVSRSIESAYHPILTALDRYQKLY